MQGLNGNRQTTNETQRLLFIDTATALRHPGRQINFWTGIHNNCRTFFRLNNRKNSLAILRHRLRKKAAPLIHTAQHYRRRLLDPTYLYLATSLIISSTKEHTKRIVYLRHQLVVSINRRYNNRL
jgi:hypothetical protein